MRLCKNHLRPLTYNIYHTLGGRGRTLTGRFWWANFLHRRLKDFYLQATSAMKSKLSFQLMTGKTIRCKEMFLFNFLLPVQRPPLVIIT